MSNTVTRYLIPFNSNSSPRSFTDVSWSNGDYILIKAVGGNNTTSLGTPSNANLTFGAIGGWPVTDGGYCWMGAWSAIAGSDQSGQSISITRTGTTEQWGAYLWVISGHDGIGSTSIDHVASGANMYRSIAVASGSSVFCLASDWSATASQTTTPTPDTNATENVDAVYSPDYRVECIDWSDQPSGTRNYGCSDSFSSSDWTIGVIEIKTLPPPPPSTAYPVETAVGGISGSSPAITFVSQPLENDVIVVFPSSTTTAVSNNITGWTSPLTTTDGHPSNESGQLDVESDTHEMACAVHLVTAAEESGSVKTWTLTNFYNATETGRIHGVLCRNVDPTNPVMAAWSVYNSAGTTSRSTAAVASGLITDNDGLVIASISVDGTSAITSHPPAGWTEGNYAVTTQTRWTGTRDTLTTSGVAVDAASMASATSDEYAGITVVLKSKPVANPTVGAYWGLKAG